MIICCAPMSREPKQVPYFPRKKCWHNFCVDHGGHIWGLAMHIRRKGKAVAMRAGQDAFYQPSFAAVLMALAVAFVLCWHGMARADDFAANPPEAAQLPDAVNGPGADRIPPGMVCSDNMDYAPEDNIPSPFDADRVAFHPTRAQGLMPISQNDGCPALRQKTDKA
jgi:hypothetical protein